MLLHVGCESQGSGLFSSTCILTCSSRCPRFFFQFSPPASMRTVCFFFFFSSRRRHTRSLCDWSSDVCSSDLDLRCISRRPVNSAASGSKKRMRFSGKIAIITAGAKGIGEATALLLAKEGASVAIVDVDMTSLQRVLEALRAEGAEAIAIEADVLSETAVAGMVRQVLDRFRPLDI